MKRTSITNIESGRQRVPLHVVYQLAESLEISPLELLPAATPSVHRSPEYTDLSEPTREWLQRVIDSAQPARRKRTSRKSA